MTFIDHKKKFKQQIALENIRIDDQDDDEEIGELDKMLEKKIDEFVDAFKSMCSWRLGNVFPLFSF